MHTLFVSPIDDAQRRSLPLIGLQLDHIARAYYEASATFSASSLSRCLHELTVDGPKVLPSST